MSLTALITAGLGLASAYMANKSSGSASDAYTSGASAQMAFNAQEAEKQRQWQEKMYKHRHQYQVEDLKLAGLNPILSATAGNPVPSGASAQGVNVNAHKPTEAIQKNQLLTNIASTAKDILLKHEMAKTEQSKQLLNTANAIKAGGTAGLPGFIQVPVSTAKQYWNAFKKKTSFIKAPKPIRGTK